jgi:multiple sugar transport system permease protein
MLFVVLIFIWKNIGFNMILYQAGLDFIPKEYYEYAAIEGAGKIRQFFIVTVVYLSPAFLLVFIMTVVNSFKIFRDVYLLSGAHPNHSVYLLPHFMNNQLANLNYQRMASASLFVFAFIYLIVVMFYRLQQRQVYG